MEAAPVNGSHHKGRGGPRGGESFRERGGGGRGAGRGRGRGGGSPFRGGERGRIFFRGGNRGRGGSSPFRGGERGRGGSGPFRGGERGRGGSSPFRGGERGRGGSNAFRGGERGRGNSRPFRGGERGRATFRGGERGRSTSRGGKGKGSQSFHSTEIFVETVIHPSLYLEEWEFKRSLQILNLPSVRIQDTQDICSFIAKHTDVSVQKIYYKLPSNESNSLEAICLFKNVEDCYRCMEKLHGQVFLDHHLLVKKYGGLNSSWISENCIKVTNLPASASEDLLWNFFESCGKLGMIHLNCCESDGILEAFVNFEDSDSVLNALKLDGSNLVKKKIEVVKLDSKLCVTISPSDDIKSMLKGYDFNVTHIEHVAKRPHGYVYFADEESYSKALKLSGKDWNGHLIDAKPSWHFVYLQTLNQGLTYEDIHAVLGSVFVKPHPRRFGVDILHYHSKSEADAALESSPVLIKKKKVMLYDSVSKIPSKFDEAEVMDEDKENESENEEDVEDEGVEDEEETEDEEEDDDEVEDEEQDDEEDEEEVEDEEVEDEEEDDEEVEDDEESDGTDVGEVSRPSNGVKVPEMQPSSITDHKRKRNDTVTLKKEKKKSKHH